MLRRVAFLVVAVTSLAMIAAPLFLPSASAQRNPQRGTTVRVVAASDGSTSGSPDAALVSRAGESLEPRSFVSSDNAYARTASATKTPYQRFDVEVPHAPDDGAVEVTWEGRAAENVEVVMSVWDVRAESWERMASEPGDEHADTTLEGSVDVDRAVDEGRVRVLLRARKTPTAAGQREPDGQFEDPDDYDFSIAWLTDTQYLSEGQVNGDERFGGAYRDMTDWIVDNAQRRKIAYAAHTGDIINNWGEHESVQSAAAQRRARAEFRFARDTMDDLADAGVPFGVTPGNHDHRTGTSSRLYNDYFPPSYFDAAEESADTGEDGRGYYGGSWREGDNQNHYDLVEASGQQLIFLYLGYVSDGVEMRWANNVLEEYGDRKAVVLTHSYLEPSDSSNGRGGEHTTGDGEGQELFDRVVTPNDNVFLTLSGHTHGVALTIKRDVGAKGRDVVEMLANYQSFEVDGERRTGFLRLLQFDTGDSTMAVNTYSPTLHEHNAEEYDTRDNRRDYDARADEFTVPVDLAGHGRSFLTDQVTVVPVRAGSAEAQ